jgi:ubiquinone biosynthesis protein
MPSRAIADIARVFALLREALIVFFSYFVRAALGRDPEPVGVAVRHALENLGLTYIKLGQYLATRFDVLPSEFCDELTKLLEEVRPASFADVRATVESEFGAPLESIYPSFALRPIASASVAQVHEARTRAGDRVAVKIQRPGIDRIFAADARNMRRLARLADFFGLLGAASMVEMVDEFSAWTNRELDFCAEAAAADRLRKTATSGEVIPCVHWHLTTKRVLTLEFIDGVSLARVLSLVESGREAELRGLLPALDIQKVGRLMTRAYLRQLLVTGFFHGDPHPGNVIVLRDNRFAFVDFGIVGYLTPYLRAALVGYLENLALGNIDESYRYYVRQLEFSDDSDMRRFASEAKQVLRRWYDASHDPLASIEERHLATYSSEMLVIIRHHRVQMPPDSLLFWRSMNMLAAAAIRVPGYFDLLGEMSVFFAANRAGIVERASGLWLNPGYWSQLTDTVRTAVHFLHGGGGRRRSWVVPRARWSRASERAQARALAPVIAGLLAVSVAIWAGMAIPR